MATTYTPNYGFGKQEEKSDKFDMSVITKNMDKIDKALYEAEEDTADHAENTTLHITDEEREKWNKNTTDIATATEQSILNRQTLGYERKNLLKNNASTRTFSGITFTVNDDGSVTINGTATANAILAISTYQIIPKGDYLCNGCTGGSSSTYYIRYVSAKSAEQTVSDNAQRQYNDDVTVTIDDEYDSIYANIVVKQGTTVDNVTLYPMIRRATDTDSTYVPYKESVEERLAKLESLVATLTTTTEET